MDLFLGPQCVSTCFSLRWLMSPRRLLVHDFNIGRAWRCTALGIDILQITHLILFVFVFLHRLYSLVRRPVISKRNNEKEMKIAVMKKDLEIEACDVTDIDAFVAEKGKATGPDILLHEFEFQGLRCSVQHKLISLLMLTLTYRTAQINTLTYALLNLLSCR